MNLAESIMYDPTATIMCVVQIENKEKSTSSEEEEQKSRQWKPSKCLANCT